jgi:CHAT domain/Kelch motif
MPAAVKEYDEIVLRIEPMGDGRYVVRGSSPEGDAQSPFELPLSRDRIDYLVLKAAFPRRGRRRMESSALQEVTELGDILFKALFRDDVRDLYRTAHAAADTRGHGLRVKLSLTDVPELTGLPWEFLYDDPSFLSISQLTPVVRYLELARTRPVREVEPPLRILAMVSSPTDAAQLDVERERANLEAALAELIAQGAVELRWLERATLAALLKELRERDFHIFHYIGHGTFRPDAQDGVLLLEDNDERGHEVSSRRLGAILHDHLAMRLAVLNACEGARTSEEDPFAGVAATLIQQGIPAVIAMQFEITDRAAIVFARHLYDALADGLPIDAALAEARKAIWADDNDVEWATPVLFMRVADGRLFDVRRTAVPVPAPAARIELTLEALPTEVPAGATVTWRACVANRGHERVTGLTPRDGGGQVLATAFDLAPGETRLVTWTTQPTTDETQVVTIGGLGDAGGAGLQASTLARIVPAPSEPAPDEHPLPGRWDPRRLPRWLIPIAAGAVLATALAAVLVLGLGSSPTGWRRLPDLPVALEGAGVARYDNRLWVVGGVAPDANRTKLKSVYIYDPGTRSWSTGPSLPVALDHAAVVSNGPKLFVLGGFSTSGSVQTVYRLDSPTGTWQQARSLPSPRGAGAAAWDGSRIVFAGGVATDHKDRADVWALEGDGWRRIGELQPARDKLAVATDHLSTVWFIAGRDEAAGVAAYPFVDVVHNDVVSPGGRIDAVQGPAAVGVGSAFCMIGGQTPTGFSGRVQCEGPNVTVPSLDRPRAGLGAAVLGTTVYVIGGYDANDQGTRTVEALDVEGAH